MNPTQHPVFTIGHSNHSLDGFIELLRMHGVDEVVDVRSAPYSRYTTQFNKDPLGISLETAGFGYVFLGMELGGRPPDRSLYDSDGRVQYERVANSDMFEDGLAHIFRNADERRITLMCTEKDPLNCHRSLLIARAIVERGVDVQHILADGSLENHQATISRLINALKLPPFGDLFRSRADVESDALMIQEKKVAYLAEEPSKPDSDWWDGF